MIVMKFGGTSVADAARIRALAEIVAARVDETPLVVVSALGGATDRLLDCAALAAAGDGPAALRGLEALAERHRATVRALDLPAAENEALAPALQMEFAALCDRLEGAALLRELTPRSRDAIVAAGELLASRLVAAALRAKGIRAVWVDPRRTLVTDGAFGAAAPDEIATRDACARELAPRLNAGEIPVTGGFVAATRDGETTTLGRGGSDYSAALLGAALDAAAIEIWTDVDGILSGDPRRLEGARRIDEMSYAEAAELAFFGAKVLHPATIRPAVRLGIPVVIRNSFNPSCPGTTVRAEAPGAGVRAVAGRRGSAALFLQAPRMLLASGYAAEVFAIFARHGVAVDVIATSEVSISVTLDAAAADEALLRDLRAVAEVTLESGLAVLTVVGRGLRATPGIAARLFGALAGVNIVMISQGASDTSVTCVVREADLDAALQRLHAAFFTGIELRGAA